MIAAVVCLTVLGSGCERPQDQGAQGSGANMTPSDGNEAGGELSGRRGARLVLEAAGAGDAAQLRELLENGAPATAHFDAEEARARHQSAMEKMKQAQAKMLAEEGMEPPFEIDFEDYFPEPTAPYSHEIPLHCAAEAGSAECIRLLVGAGADVNFRDESGETALFAASNAEAVRALLEAGATTDILTQFDRDALDEALEDAWGDGEPSPGKLDVASVLLEAGVPLERPDEDGWSRLTQMAFRHNPIGVRFLLDAGHPVSDGEGYTALHGLCWNWDHDDPDRDKVFPEIIQMLLDAGVPVDVRDADGNTALHECVAGDGANLVAARYLLSKGADVNARNNLGQTPLIFLYDSHHEYEKVVPFLLDHGANPLITDQGGKNAIDHARDRAAAVEPQWRIDQFKERGEEIEVGWKEKATPGDAEYRLIELMEKAAEKFR